MAALEAATHYASGRERMDSFAPADADAMGGRVKPGHDGYSIRDMSAMIFKICHGAEWEDAARDGSYVGSAKDRADGFLHFSTAKQLMGTLQKYYTAEKDLVLVAVNKDLLGAALKYEPSRDGDLFPHLYAPLLVSAVKWVREIARDSNGGFVLPLDPD